MELNNDDNNARRRMSEKEDQLSMLPDDVLLCILGRVGDLNTAVATSMLSTRWRLVPWLLPELDIDVQNFMSDPHSKPNEASAVHDAMLAITEAIKSLFSKPRRESIVARLQLKLFLVDTLLCDIGALLCEAIDRGLLKDLDLAILDEKEPYKWSASDVLKRVQDMDGFFRAYPSVSHCLTTLSLYTLDFVQLDMDHILFECCTQLKHLKLSFCHAGPSGLWKIDAPNSKLCILELDRCWFQTIELISLPKLKKVKQLILKFNDPSLSFGCVPALEELELEHFLYLNQHSLTLSELLHGATGIHTLTLNFIGSTIWLRPEIKQLASPFSMLRKLFILGVFVQFDLLWSTSFLEAAPSIEVLHIEVFEPCEKQYEYIPGLADKRTNPQWELDFRGSKNMVLRELHIVGFRPLQQQLTFIRAIMDRAPNLQKVVLIMDDEKRDKSSENKEEQDMVVGQITGGKSFIGRAVVTLRLSFLDSSCRSALLFGGDGAGADRADGPGGAAGEHGDAGLRVAHARLPARRRVGRQDAHQGGYARQGGRRHGRLLRHRRAGGLRVRAARREPGAGGAAGVPAVRGQGQRPRARRRAGARRRRRRRQGGRLPQARRRHHQLLRPAGPSGEHGEPGPRLLLRGGRRHRRVPSPHGHQLLGERVPDLRRSAAPAPEPRPDRRQRLRRALAAHAQDEPLLRGEGGGDRLLRDAAVRGEGGRGHHRRHARLDRRRARRQQALGRGKRGIRGPGAAAAVDQGGDDGAAGGRAGGGGVRAGGGGRRVPRGRPGAAARLVRRVPRLPRLRARRARLDVPAAAVHGGARSAADGRTPRARSSPRAAAGSACPPADRVPGGHGGGCSEAGPAAQARVSDATSGAAILCTYASVVCYLLYEVILMIASSINSTPSVFKYKMR